jgi:hypothetical protein
VLMLSCPLPAVGQARDPVLVRARRRWPARSRGRRRRSGTPRWRRPGRRCCGGGPGCSPAVAGRLLHAGTVPARAPAVPGSAEVPGRRRGHRAGGAGHDGADRRPAQARGKAAGAAVPAGHRSPPAVPRPVGDSGRAARGGPGRDHPQGPGHPGEHRRARPAPPRTWAWSSAAISRMSPGSLRWYRTGWQGAAGGLHSADRRWLLLRTARRARTGRLPWLWHVLNARGRAALQDEDDCHDLIPRIMVAANATT